MNFGDEWDPLTAAPVLPPAAPAVRALAVRSQRLLIAGSCLWVAALGVGMAGVISAGFVHRELLLCAAVLALLGLPMCVSGSRGTRQAVAASGYPRTPGVVGVIQPGYLLEPETPAWPSMLVLLALPPLFFLSVGLLPSVLAARTLAHPVAGTAVSDISPTCSGCQARSITTFRLTDGRLVTSKLAGVMGPVSDGAGTAVIYDADNPSHAISGSDYQRGGSGRRLGQLAFAVLGQVAVMAWAMATTRSRRRAFGDGRAHVGIRSVWMVPHARGRNSLQVNYADGRSVRFADTPPQRSALLRRIEDDPGGFRLADDTLRRLTTGRR